jgi:hypothetical protein
MPSFTTVDHDVAKRLRVAHLTGRLVTGTAGDYTLTMARIRSVRRDIIAAVPRWTVDVDDEGVSAQVADTPAPSAEMG